MTDFRDTRSRPSPLASARHQAGNPTNIGSRSGARCSGYNRRPLRRDNHADNRVIGEIRRDEHARTIAIALNRHAIRTRARQGLTGVKCAQCAHESGLRNWQRRLDGRETAERPTTWSLSRHPIPHRRPSQVSGKGRNHMRIPAVSTPFCARRAFVGRVGAPVADVDGQRFPTTRDTRSPRQIA